MSINRIDERPPPVPRKLSRRGLPNVRTGWPENSESMRQPVSLQTGSETTRLYSPSKGKGAKITRATRKL